MNRRAREYIAAHWREESDAAMARALDMSGDSVGHIRYRMDLLRTEDEARALQPKWRVYNHTLKQYILDNAASESDRGMAAIWNVPPRVIAYHRRMLGVRRR